MVGDDDPKLDVSVQLDDDAFDSVREFEAGDDPIELAADVVAFRAVRHCGPTQRAKITHDQAITAVLESVLVSQREVLSADAGVPVLKQQD